MTEERRKELRVLCNAAKHPYNSEKVRSIYQLLEETLDALDESERKRSEAQSILDKMDFQAIGKLLGLPAGTIVSKNIQPGIERLLRELQGK